MRRLLRILAAAGLAALLGGCGPSFWNYEFWDGPTSSKAGHVNGPVGDSFKAATFALGQQHVFYQDQDAGNFDLRHSWLSPSGAFLGFEVIDGSTASRCGNNSTAGQHAGALEYGGTAHVFYSGSHPSEPTQIAQLRHAFWTGSGWRCEVLDGTGSTGPGRTQGNQGEDITALLFGGVPHVFSYGDTSPGTSASGPYVLRHAWWDGARWHLETIDGVGGVAIGATTNSTGWGESATVFATGPHVFYRDSIRQALRHAWWNGARWQAEELDGWCPCTFGRTNHLVAEGISAIVFGSGPHVFYRDDTDEALRHGFYDGTRWRFETLDGLGATSPWPGQDSTATIDPTMSAVLYGGLPHVFYQDRRPPNSVLRHGFWTGSGWRFESLDGADAGPRGRIDADTGNRPRAIVAPDGGLYVWEGSASDLRLAVYRPDPVM